MGKRHRINRALRRLAAKGKHEQLVHADAAMARGDRRALEAVVDVDSDYRRLPESPRRKRSWLHEMARRLPLGARVHVIGGPPGLWNREGMIVGLRKGDIGEYPSVLVHFDDMEDQFLWENDLVLVPTRKHR